MAKSAQERFNELVAERDKLKKEINKWIYTTQKMERERDGYKEILSKILISFRTVLEEYGVLSEKKT